MEKANTKKSIYDLLQTDNKLEEEGVDIFIGDSKFKILRASKNNKKYLLAMTQFNKQHGKQMDRGYLSEEKATELMTKIYADTIVIGWENVIDQKGNEIPYSKEMCLKLLRDLPELFSIITQEASNISNFKTEEKDTKKKSLSS